MLTGKHALVAFGSNQNFGGNPPKTVLAEAIKALKAEGLVVERLSKLYNTPCFPVGAGPDYVNAAALVTLRQAVQPQQILACLHRVEAAFGRERIDRWAGRTLDIDLLAVGDLVAPDLAGFRHWQELPLAEQARLAPAELILPHPRLQDRAFVLVPLADVVPDWVHPVLGLSVVQMLAALPAADRAAVTELPPAAAI
jgi:2-amino-4-hydroxy-6-hydroxymethyldihydropteridine diphosphokinase